MSETTIARGATFEAHSHPTADEFIVLETDEISGYEAVHLVEREGNTWRDYWSKTRYIHDETNLGASEHTGFIGEDLLTQIEDAL